MTIDKHSDFIQEAEKRIKKYQDILSNIGKFLDARYEKKNLDIQGYEKTLSNKFKEAEKKLKSFKGASEKEYETIKDSLNQLLDEIKGSLYDFSKYLSIDQLYKGKNELLSFGNEKLEEAQTLLKTHPFMAAGSALSIGFIIGRLFGHSK